MVNKMAKCTLLTLMMAAVVTTFSFASCFAAASPVKGNEATSHKNVRSSVLVYDLNEKGAVLTKVWSKKVKSLKTATAPAYVTKDGKKYAVVAVKKNAFKGAKKLKTIKFKAKKALKVEKGAFKGLKTDKMTIKLNKKMPKKQSAKFKKALKKAGFKGTIK